MDEDVSSMAMSFVSATVYFIARFVLIVQIDVRLASVDDRRRLQIGELDRYSPAHRTMSIWNSTQSTSTNPYLPLQVHVAT